MKYLMLITYSWDSDYVAIPCETEAEAIEWLEKYLTEEIATVENESEYTPILRRYSDTEAELVYEEAEEFVGSTSDIATYKVIEIGHGFDNPKFVYTGTGLKYDLSPSQNSGTTLGSVQTERGIIQVEANYQSAERAEMDGYRFAFHSDRIGKDIYSIALDDRGLCHSFAVIER